MQVLARLDESEKNIDALKKEIAEQGESYINLIDEKDDIIKKVTTYSSYRSVATCMFM